MKPVSLGYEPKQYWAARVTGNGTLANVGQTALGPYNEYTYPLRLEAFERALAGMVPENGSVFDGGFGEGVYLDYWRQRGHRRVAGIDLSPRAVSANRAKHGEYDLRYGDLSNPRDFAGFGRYDVVTAVDVLYHVVDDRAWAAALRNLLGLVARRGIFVFSDKFPVAGAFQSVSHVRRRSLDMWEAVLGEQQFQVARRVPVFWLMDDPITCGSHPLLGRLSQLQWRVGTKLIRSTAGRPAMQRGVARAVAMAQIVPERFLLRTLATTPNLEMVVCCRPGSTAVEVGR
jgi:hypothetical protein